MFVALDMWERGLWDSGNGRWKHKARAESVAEATVSARDLSYAAAILTDRPAEVAEVLAGRE